MKKLLLLLMSFAIFIGINGQKISNLTEATTAPTGSLLMVRQGTTGNLIKKITVDNLLLNYITGEVTDHVVKFGRGIGVDSVWMPYVPYAFREDIEAVIATGFGEYNIRDYGATEGGTVEDQTAIQAAIDASVAWYSPEIGLTGTVRIPAGAWYITAPIVLKTYSNVVIDYGAVFKVPVDYEDCVFTCSDIYAYASLTGGFFRLNKTTSFFKKVIPNGGYMAFNRFQNINVYEQNIMFDISREGSGWGGANIFGNFQVFRAKAFIKSGGGSISGCLFSNILFQTWTDETYAVIDTLDGEFNQFTNLMVYDFDVAVDTAWVYRISGDNNMIFGGNLIHENNQDNGNQNTVWSNRASVAEVSFGNNNVKTNEGFIGTQEVFTPYNFNSVTNESGINEYMLHRVMYFSYAGDIDFTANPQIIDGQDGQICTIIGSSDSNTLTLDDGDGLALSAQWISGLGDSITLIYIEALDLWVEIGRTNN